MDLQPAPTGISQRLAYILSAVILVFAGVFVIFILVARLQGSKTQSQLNQEVSQIDNLSKQIKQLSQENKDLNQKNVNYAYCNAMLIAKYTQTLKPIQIQDLNKCVLTSGATPNASKVQSVLQNSASPQVSVSSGVTSSGTSGTISTTSKPTSGQTSGTGSTSGSSGNGRGGSSGTSNPQPAAQNVLQGPVSLPVQVISPITLPCVALLGETAC